ncbi:MAG: DUF6208 family protein [Chloroflexi bacterium]|nr:DUF6208 family protein [Chloroflexota bacterium]MCI0578423.1 DUF6208 family protein [Chloroflexota bacterium]MCI0648163.1 DUF6208 family protein [Chloroflexota bacterium]MCI0726678.1 DUF6208 family protein [Chloroflexota bacterium]
MNKSRSRLSALYEIPLAVLSFLFYKTIRYMLRRGVVLLSGRLQEQATNWRVLDQEGLERPLALPVTMTTGPRWNPHAMIATAGPFEVRQAISFDVDVVRQAAQSWTAVVYCLADNSLVSRIGSLDGPFADRWQTFRLEPGMYMLGIRYYKWSRDIALPEVWIDGEPFVSARAIKSEPNQFYAHLHERASFFYLCLHYYISPLLRYRDRFSRAFVEREFLPVGNPETRFAYGLLRKGRAWHVELEQQLLETYNIYFTAYDRRSFPTFWYEIVEARHQTPESPTDGFYLVRLHQKVPAAGRLGQEWIKLTCVND